jgi:23S rRNA pseudouridine1911/1915/1917 synthase
MLDFNDMIVYEDDHIIVLNKPLGLAVQTADENTPSIENWLASNYENYYLITRLDQVVSGLVLIAKDKPTSNWLGRRINKPDLDKTYLALVEGHPKEKRLTVSKRLIKKGSKAYVNKNGKKAVLHYEVLNQLDNYTFLKVKIEFGRFHQIRCLLGHIGYPIKGDVKYGSRRNNKGEKGIYLHCNELKIEGYGDKKQPLTINAPHPSMKLWELWETN